VSTGRSKYSFVESEQEHSAIFTERFLRSYRLLHFIAGRVLGDEERSSIAIQNCWRTASRNPRHFEYEGAFRSWLVRVLIDEAMVHRGQHFRMRHSSLSCAGAPIFDPLGRLAAVLDTSSMNPQTTEQSLSLAMAATKVSARGIEERIFREYFRHAWNIAAAPRGGGDAAILLAVDNDQRILGADHIARRLFSLSDEVLNRGMALATIFEYDSSIFRCKRMQDVAARLLRTGTEEPWNALITPPACGMSVLCSPTDALLHSRPRCGMLAHLPLSVDPPMNRGGLAPARANRICEYIDLHL
jgi:hypothetical protein